MEIMTVGTLKGGVGKSTIAFFLACELAKDYSVFLIDTDAQETAMEAWQDRENIDEDLPRFTAFMHGKPRLDRAVERLKTDIVIIDTGGHLNPSYPSAVRVSDYLIIPLSASTFDLRSTEKTFALVEHERSGNPDLKVKVLINLAPTNSDVDTELLLTELEDFQKDFDFQIFNTILHTRRIYARASAHGLTPLEYGVKSKDTKAFEEYTNFMNEVKSW